MQELSWIIAALFLPLFPLGMVFNALFQRVHIVWLRVALLLAWPLPGVWILQDVKPIVPDWVIYWALFSALLYGFRAVVVKEVGVWIGFLATSTWALAWIGFELFSLTVSESVAAIGGWFLPSMSSPTYPTRLSRSSVLVAISPA